MQHLQLFCVNESDCICKSLKTLPSVTQPQKRHKQTLNVDFKWISSVNESTEWSSFSFQTQAILFSQPKAVHAWVSISKWLSVKVFSMSSSVRRCSVYSCLNKPHVSVLPNHSWSFPRWEEKIWKQFSCSCLMQWSGTTHTLGEYCASLTLLSLFLSPSWQVFCKYQMQLRCKQSAGMLCMYMWLITTYPEGRRAAGKAKQRYFDIFDVITVLRS